MANASSQPATHPFSANSEQSLALIKAHITLIGQAGCTIAVVTTMLRSLVGFCRSAARMAVLICFIIAMPLAAGAEPGDGDSPDGILHDALDALHGNKVDLARELFDDLIADYPGTPEAGRAALELEQLNRPAAASRAVERPARPGVTVPASRVAELRRAFLIDVGDRVFFAENSADIGGRARMLLEHQAKWLKARPQLIVTIIGRADDGGSAQSAIDLSLKRAEGVRAKLIASGVEEQRVLIDARGDRDPLATCRSAMCQSQNRHVETLIGAPQQATQTPPLPN